MDDETTYMITGNIDSSITANNSITNSSITEDIKLKLEDTYWNDIHQRVTLQFCYAIFGALYDH